MRDYIPNPNGRPVGSRNKRDAEIWARLEARGDLDPADFLSSIITNKSDSSELRTQAANMLMPYKYGTRGAIPSPRYIEEPLQLPQATTIEQSIENIAFVSDLKATGKIDLDFECAGRRPRPLRPCAGNSPAGA